MTTDTPRRGRKPSQEKRDSIIAAALSAFAHKGVEATTTREIALAAETTERTLFKHFGSKDGLVRAVVEAAAIELMRQRSFARIADPEPLTLAEFVDWHRAFLTERVEAARAAPGHYAVIFRRLLDDSAFQRGFVDQWKDRVFAPLMAHLAQMQARGEIAADLSPAHLAGTFYSLNLSYLVARFVLSPHDPWDDTANIEAIVTTFRKTCGR